MKKLTLYLTLFLFINALGALSAACLPNFDLCSFYLRAGGGLSIHRAHQFCSLALEEPAIATRDYKTGCNLHSAVGYQFIDCFSLEAEVFYQTSRLDTITLEFPESRQLNTVDDASGRTTDLALLANLVYSIPLVCGIEWFASAGLGISFNTLKLTQQAGLVLPKKTKRKDLFAWQLRTGLNYPLNSRLSLYGAYRFFKTGKVCTPIQNICSTKKPHSHNAELGLMIHF